MAYRAVRVANGRTIRVVALLGLTAGCLPEPAGFRCGEEGSTAPCTATPGAQCRGGYCAVAVSRDTCVSGWRFVSTAARPGACVAPTGDDLDAGHDAGSTDDAPALPDDTNDPLDAGVDAPDAGEDVQVAVDRLHDGRDASPDARDVSTDVSTDLPVVSGPDVLEDGRDGSVPPRDASMDGSALPGPDVLEDGRDASREAGADSGPRDAGCFDAGVSVVCGALVCPPGRADCDGVAGNGCEVDTNTDPMRCGGCEERCGTAQDCQAGRCVDVAHGVSCRAVHNTLAHVRSGPYRIDPDGAGPLPMLTLYCDMDRDGGGWTLVEVGRAQGVNLWTRNAVNTLDDVRLTTSAKLSREYMAALLLSGDRRLRIGDLGRYGELYLGPLETTWIRDGLGTTGFGTVVVGQYVGATLTGRRYAGSRFAWPLDGPPAACLNSDGGSRECGLGLHLGTWRVAIGTGAVTPHRDALFVNFSGTSFDLRPDNGYRIWVR